MNVQVRLFARAREVIGSNLVTAEVPETATVADLRKHLSEQFPALAPMMGQMMLAVDAEYADEDRPLRPDAEVACIPPVSGGCAERGSALPPSS